MSYCTQSKKKTIENCCPSLNVFLKKSFPPKIRPQNWKITKLTCGIRQSMAETAAENMIIRNLIETDVLKCATKWYTNVDVK